MPDLLFIHSAGSQTDGEGSSALLAHLKQGLSGDYHVIAPVMPDSTQPHYATWAAQLATLLPTLNPQAVLVGHSLGGAILLKYLTEAVNGTRPMLNGVYIIAAPYWGADEQWDVDEFKFRDNTPQLVSIARKVYFYHSHDDSVVPFNHLTHYARKFPEATLQAVDDAGHLFMDGDGARLVIADILSNSAGKL